MLGRMAARGAEVSQRNDSTVIYLSDIPGTTNDYHGTRIGFTSGVNKNNLLI